MSAPLIEMYDMCLGAAREHESQARRLRKLARRIIDPGPGVTVEWGDRGVVRFIGPILPPAPRSGDGGRQ